MKNKCFKNTKDIFQSLFYLDALIFYYISISINPLSASVARNQSIDLLCKSIDWFLYEGNTGI